MLKHGYNGGAALCLYGQALRQPAAAGHSSGGASHGREAGGRGDAADGEAEEEALLVMQLRGEKQINVFLWHNFMLKLECLPRQASIFAKTGSGQAHSEYPKREDVFVFCCFAEALFSRVADELSGPLLKKASVRSSLCVLICSLLVSTCITLCLCMCFMCVSRYVCLCVPCGYRYYHELKRAVGCGRGANSAAARVGGAPPDHPLHLPAPQPAATWHHTGTGASARATCAVAGAAGAGSAD